VAGGREHGRGVDGPPGLIARVKRRRKNLHSTPHPYRNVAVTLHRSGVVQTEISPVGATDSVKTSTPWDATRTV
jgi:hypothetical protein